MFPIAVSGREVKVLRIIPISNESKWLFKRGKGGCGIRADKETNTRWLALGF